MKTRILDRSDTYVANHCARHLARDSTEPRHDFGQYAPGDPRARVSEAWRFPIVDSYAEGGNFLAGHRNDAVTFVHVASEPLPGAVELVGSFGPLHERVPLRRVADAPWWTVTLVLPKGRVYTYLYLVDGQPTVDPVNPQRVVQDSGTEWSRVFTSFCGIALTFEEPDRALLTQLTRHILPFERPEIQALLDRHYERLDRRPAALDYLHVYGPEPSMGAVNYIDKMLAREESHHLIDYRLCLPILRSLLISRHPGASLASLPAQTFAALFAEMAANSVAGWNYAIYSNPRHFLKLLHRHTVCGAFSHPKYGGNAGVGAWVMLEERYRDPANPMRTLFDWRAALEKPLGDSSVYHGIFEADGGGS